MKITVTQTVEINGKRMTRKASADLDTAISYRRHGLVAVDIGEHFPKTEIDVVSKALVRAIQAVDWREEEKK
jgi:hypothetical protein